jgi:hypothetical protein
MPERSCCGGMNKPNLVMWWSYCAEHDEHETSVFGGTVDKPTAQEMRNVWGPFASFDEVIRFLNDHLELFAGEKRGQQSML